ncbi:MAG: aspartate kinase [Eubacteriaceae bacterium]|jgi:aspartate kinase|uniref:Aspartokinase n=1 Tax=Candidatus Pseudoramibacter fermentans TaxID=2594427 RepID=A0A6L5GSU7_9FIRM|nr:aspartate kinase [Candidatus Pseudoramibacter fermentans]RRF93135.1 MAG: aspartate kinase [Eubacteriaceae bacterium]
MNTIVQKYGGTSMGTIARIQNVAKRIIAKKEQGNRMVVVVSAMGKSTDHLVEMAYAVNDKPPKREMDMLLATGEQVSISMLSMALDEMGYKAISFTGPQVGIKTEGLHGRARIMDVDKTKIVEALDEDKIVIVAGFQGVNENDDITTLGRGGSDTSAVALSVVLGCPCEIYTDVDGIYGVDPRLYPPAKKLDVVSYDEMLEMASLGAGVMNPRAIELGRKYNADILVASSINKVPGTLITSNIDQQVKDITGLAVYDDEMMVSIKDVPYRSDVAAQLFADLAEAGINVDMISQTKPVNDKMHISFSLSKEDRDLLDRVLPEFQAKYEGTEVTIRDDTVKLSVVGSGMKLHSGVASRFFALLCEQQFPILMVTTSDIRISCMIPKEAKERVVMAVADGFEL